MKIHFPGWFLILALVLSSCSIQVEQPAVITPASTLESIPPTLASEESSPQTNIVTTTQIPVTWGDLNLTGRLVYINGTVVDLSLIHI